VLVFLGKPAEALTLLRAAELRGSQSAQATLCWALVKTGDRASAQRVLDRLTSNGNGFISQYCRSRCLVALEHETEALQALDSAEGEFQLRLLALDPWFASLRTDARFEAIVRKHAISEVVSKI
jgi:hypothetical protein